MSETKKENVSQLIPLSKYDLQVDSSDQNDELSSSTFIRARKVNKREYDYTMEVYELIRLANIPNPEKLILDAYEIRNTIRPVDPLVELQNEGDYNLPSVEPGENFRYRVTDDSLITVEKEEIHKILELFSPNRVLESGQDEQTAVSVFSEVKKGDKGILIRGLFVESAGQVAGPQSFDSAQARRDHGQIEQPSFEQQPVAQIQNQEAPAEMDEFTKARLRFIAPDKAA